MSLIVETGAGLSNAEAYASVDEADTYFANRGQSDAWDAVDDKEAAMRLATDYMTQAFRTRWAGMRATTTQALDWPRAYVPILDGPGGYRGSPSYYALDAVPAEVKAANILLALKTSTLELLPDATQKVIEKTVGPISVKYDPDAPVTREFSAVESLLEPFFSSSSGTVELIRA